MLFIKEYVKASSIWPTAEDHKDIGYIEGYVRGYNIEVARPDGSTFWWTCEYIVGAPETEFDDKFHRLMYSDQNCTPTGRACFRGYGKCEWDDEERDYFVVPVQV